MLTARSPEVASRQAGVFTRGQARSAGWSAYQVRHRIGDGTWTALPGRGLVASGTPLEPLTLAWATYLSAPDGVVSHATAAGVHGFPVPTAAVDGRVGHVITLDRNEVRGVARHLLRLSPGETCRVDGLPVTSRRRTAIDCLAGADRDGALHLWAWLASRRVLTRSQLAEDVRARLGCAGTPQLLRILALTGTGAASVAELGLHRLLRSAGLTGWAANVTVRARSGRVIAVVDVLFARQRLVIEVDGYAAHAGRSAFVQDRRRQNALVNAGYRVLRVTWSDLRDRPHEVIAEIEVALSAKITD